MCLMVDRCTLRAVIQSCSDKIAVKARMFFSPSWSGRGVRVRTRRSSGIQRFWHPLFQCSRREELCAHLSDETRLVLAGKSKAEIAQAIAAAFDKKVLPALEPGAMAYMMSKQPHLNDWGQAWHPHAMFFSPGNMTKSWAADGPSSPVMVANDPEERVTILFVLADKWSDCSTAPSKTP